MSVIEKNGTWMVRIVQHNHVLVLSSKSPTTRRSATFQAGERLEVRRIYSAGAYPTMYAIRGRRELGIISRGVLTLFLKGFEPRAKRPERTARA